MPYSAYTWFFRLCDTFLSALAYPAVHTCPTVALDRISPGVQAGSGRWSRITQPAVLVCTPHFGAATPAGVGVPARVGVTVSEGCVVPIPPHPLSNIARIRIRRCMV